MACINVPIVATGDEFSESSASMTSELSDVLIHLDQHLHREDEREDVVGNAQEISFLQNNE